MSDREIDKKDGIGQYVSDHSREGYWGTGTVARISKQFKSELLGLKGFSEDNIKLMRRFYEAWKDIETNSVVSTTEFQKTGYKSDLICQLQFSRKN